jgi:Immunity protein 51
MKWLYSQFVFLIVPFCFFGCQESSSAQQNSASESSFNKNVMNNFPFKTHELGGRFAIVAETESAELYPKYAEFFEQFGYSGNGYCWEGHIVQILEKIDPELLLHIKFDPEAGAFYAYADAKENQLKFVELLGPIFSDLNQLKNYVDQADRSRIDD